MKNALSFSNEDFRINYSKVAHYFDMSRNHCHNTYEIYYLLSGQRYYFIKDRTFHVMKGDIVLINAYDLHKTTTLQDSPAFERIMLQFHEDFLDFISEVYPDVQLLSCFKSNIRVVRLCASEQKEVEAILNKLLALYNDYRENMKNRNNELYIKIKLAELLLFLNKKVSSGQTGSFEHPSSMHRKVSEIVTYINKNYMNDLTLDFVSSEFYISKYYFSRVFKSVTGLTFVNYLNIVRVKEAQKLLRETKLSVTNITEKVGYGSMSHFEKVFKDYTGFSPLEYRKTFR